MTHSGDPDPSRFYEWTVKIRISATWVADGFDLTDARAQAMLQRELPHVTSAEASAEVVNAPSADAVAQEMGYADAADREARKGAKHGTIRGYMKQDGLMHLRKTPDAPTKAAAWCGKTDQATVNDAAGFYGPEGKGWDQICKNCVDEKHKATGRVTNRS